ncbi:FAD-binding and (Fe-S)-binding domain-containing protein [Bacteroides helcogenes]|uniref:D-lactate dehydrogenase (cytochrome) n=1 Tax=Bacteroides helcogenes (strain ATCC 35417 / DSM 20613 / JCM 6297 / CCUG 15421 / P 36-108) TaxID=693979 RepID=E6SUZ0_BACT6|nr:FAD-binding and (Fe-S)-binding domain-containing protein [Bacteroides helcogenes]ADV42426.1 FAD linked oxidase domain protein [Bacteroides helcogenes P 36-108]
MVKDSYTDFSREALRFIPKERIYTDELHRLTWGTDAGFYRLIPRIVIHAAEEGEVAGLLKLAGRYSLPVTFRAAGTSLSGQAISNSILIVAGKHWEQYSISADHEQITLEPGIIGQRVNELLAPYGRKFAPDPASVKSAMVGGIVMNNASGMNCGTHANSDRMLLSARIVLADGTVLDTGNPVSRASFEVTHRDFIRRICELRDEIRGNEELAARIRHKYSIKNVTGLNLLPFVRFDDPFDIIAHLMVGSEGTLAFLSRVTMKTEYDYPCKASAMLYFKTIKEASRAVVAMKRVERGEGKELKVESGELKASRVESGKLKVESEEWKASRVESGELKVESNHAECEESATQHSAANSPLSTLNSQLSSTPNSQLSTLNSQLVKSAEMLDYKSLSSVNDPVFLKYKGEVASSALPGVEPGDETGLTAVLTETKAHTPEELRQNIAAIETCLASFDTYIPVHFTDRPEEYSEYWAIRSGIFPSVGGTRKPGTSCLIEDVAFHIEDLPEATADLQQLLARHGYNDACIYGHALEGNYHFIINQSFSNQNEVDRYKDLMEDIKTLVVDKYDGSLKAEHGTGRNMAPFVRYEWGDDAYRAMKAVKELFDPEGLLNPGVIFNDDPQCHIKGFKYLPAISVDEEHRAIGYQLQSNPYGLGIVAVCPPLAADKCIECGFCEVNCLSCGFTLSPRQRIVAQREMSLLKQAGMKKQLAILQRQYDYPGNQTCAGDGLCSMSCPMGINTGDLTHLIRQEALPKGSLGYKAGSFAANHFAGIKSAVRPVLRLADTAHSLLGTKAMSALAKTMHNVLHAPLWTPAMPKAYKYSEANSPESTRRSVRGGTVPKVVYFPSCINQTMGQARKSPAEQPLARKMLSLLQKAGYEVILPKNMERLCCGTIWESKGMPDIADRKTEELEAALWEASGQGLYPVLCDQSPCLHRMRRHIKKMKLYEPAEFIYTFMRDKLTFTPTDRPVAVHITCSMREMGLADTITALAGLCSTRVLVPEEVGCCGFAGDRGFTHPELNAYALRKLRPQVEASGVKTGYSNSRTCEIGLTTNSGIPYVSIVYLVDECTRPADAGNE